MATPISQHVVFALDDLQYALRLAAVERVERAVAVLPLPKAPGIVLGVINLFTIVAHRNLLTQLAGRANRGDS